MPEKLILLESLLGQGHKANRDYYQFQCPFCNHHKPKLGVSIGTGKWKCWVCGVNGSKVTVLLNKLSAPNTAISKAKSLFVESSSKFQSAKTALSLPPEYKPLWKGGAGLFYDKAKNYLLGRGLTDLDFYKYRIGYCETGKYRDMVIFPFYDVNGSLVYFTARSYLKNPMFAFSAPTGVDKDHVYDEGLVNWSEPIVLVESRLDAIVVRRNAVPLNGKQISKSLFNKILDENVSVIYLCLDGDAVKEIMKYSKWFAEHGIEVFITEFPLDEGATKKEGRPVYHDPTSLGHNRVWEHINSAKKVTETDSFKFNILSRLCK